MTTNAEKAANVKQVYDEGMAEVFRIVSSFEATPKQREVAQQTASDLSSMLIAQTLDSIQGRTALLSGPIVELNEVIDSVETEPPFQNSLDNLTGVLTKAQMLFREEKKELT